MHSRRLVVWGLTIGVLLITMLLLILRYSAPGLFPGSGGFQTGLHGKVPSYKARRTTGTRECSFFPEYEDYCYYVTTDAYSKQALVLIVEDVIRKQHLSKSPNKTTAFIFYTGRVAGEGVYEAVAFKDKAEAKKWAKECVLERGQDCSAIDGVYIRKIH